MYYPVKTVSLTNYIPLNVRIDEDGFYHPYITPFDKIEFENKYNGTRLSVSVDEGDIDKITIKEDVIDLDRPMDIDDYAEGTGIRHFFVYNDDPDLPFYGIECINILITYNDTENGWYSQQFPKIRARRIPHTDEDFYMDYAKSIGLTACKVYHEHTDEKVVTIYEDECEDYGYKPLWIHHSTGFYFAHRIHFVENPIYFTIKNRLEKLLGPVLNTRINLLNLLKPFDFLPGTGREYLKAKEHFERMNATYC